MRLPLAVLERASRRGWLDCAQILTMLLKLECQGIQVGISVVGERICETNGSISAILSGRIVSGFDQIDQYSR
jgi:hypothetical protein